MKVIVEISTLKCTNKLQETIIPYSIDYISFSAHTDYEQTSEFIRILNPPHIVSVIIISSAQLINNN